jgi:lipopolysaccharide export LptBFGC system permease protein LptF
MGLLLSLALFALNERWLSDSAESAERILQRHLPNQKSPAARQWEQNFGFLNERANRQWFAQAYNKVTHVMVRPHVEWTLPRGTRYVIDAERAFRCDGVWVFTNVQELVFSPTPGALPTPKETNLLAMSTFSETPEEIESQIKINRVNINSLRDVRKTQLSVREILDYKRLRLGNSRMDAILDTKLHGRLAAPWTCLVVVLIALPFGAASGRRNVFVGVASSLLICFTYFVLLQLALALGSRGSVLPWLAAWTPNLLFGATGILLACRVR